MSHESVWYSRPRTYGKGSRSWYVAFMSIEKETDKERIEES